MSRILAILALVCLNVALADRTGSVSVNITSLDLVGDSITQIDREIVDFTYDANEFNNEAANFNDEWSFTEYGTGEFILSSADGDKILIDALNSNNNAYLDDILNKVVTAVGGGNTTVASNIGNSIIAGIQANAVRPVVQQPIPTASIAAAAAETPAPVVIAPTIVTPTIITQSTAAEVVETENGPTIVTPTIITPSTAAEVVETENDLESEIVISEYVPLAVALGPAPIEVVISEENFPNGTVVTTISKYYSGAANFETTPVSNVTEAVEAVEVVEVVESTNATEVVEATESAEFVEAAPVVSTIAPEFVEVAPESVLGVELAGAEATEVLVTEVVNPNGTITTITRRFYDVGSSQIQPAEGAQQQ